MNEHGNSITLAPIWGISEVRSERPRRHCPHDSVARCLHMHGYLRRAMKSNRTKVSVWVPFPSLNFGPEAFVQRVGVWRLDVAHSVGENAHPVPSLYIEVQRATPGLDVSEAVGRGVRAEMVHIIRSYRTLSARLATRPGVPDGMRERHRCGR